MEIYYVLACVFGFGMAAIAGYGIWRPDFLKGKSVVPVTILSLVLFALTLGASIVGAINEENEEGGKAALESKAAAEAP